MGKQFAEGVSRHFQEDGRSFFQRIRQLQIACELARTKIAKMKEWDWSFVKVTVRFTLSCELGYWT